MLTREEESPGCLKHWVIVAQMEETYTVSSASLSGWAQNREKGWGQLIQEAENGKWFATQQRTEEQLNETKEEFPHRGSGMEELSAKNLKALLSRLGWFTSVRATILKSLQRESSESELPLHMQGHKLDSTMDLGRKIKLGRKIGVEMHQHEVDKEDGSEEEEEGKEGGVGTDEEDEEDEDMDVDEEGRGGSSSCKKHSKRHEGEKVNKNKTSFRMDRATDFDYVADPSKWQAMTQDIEEASSTSSDGDSDDPQRHIMLKDLLGKGHKIIQKYHVAAALGIMLVYLQGACGEFHSKLFFQLNLTLIPLCGAYV